MGRHDRDAAAGGDLSGVGVFGGYIVGVHLIGIDPGAFWSQMQANVSVWDDVGNGIPQERGCLAWR